MTGHRYASTGRQALSADRGTWLPDPGLPADWHAGCLVADRQDLVAVRRLAPGTLSGHQGLDPRAETWALAPATAGAVMAGNTPAGYRETSAGTGMGGRGLCHPQDGPLTLTGAAELQPGPGPRGQLRSRTANRMAVPSEPFH